MGFAKVIKPAITVPITSIWTDYAASHPKYCDAKTR
jgi:hypothetical protein